MNIISKTFNTLAQIVDKRIATFKVVYDACSKCDIRDKVFIERRYFGNSNDCVTVLASDLILRSLGVPVDYPSATCIPPRVGDDSNSYYICLSLCTLNDPIARNALIAHECGHILHKHPYNAAITDSKQGVIFEVDYEIEADRFACELGMSGAMRKIIINAKETSLRGLTTRKNIEAYDARLKAIDDWEASHK